MTLDRRQLAAIYLGGMLGAVARVALVQAFPAAPGHWPWITLIVNLTGTFVLGATSAGLRELGREHGLRRALLGTGFCGAYTTFSTLQLELLRMIDAGRLPLAAAYAVVSVGGGLLAVRVAARMGHRAVASLTAEAGA